VWRAERAGGDTKTPESRRTLALPRKCVEALREHRVRQAEDRLAAGPLWQDHGLVFASAVGTPMDDHNVRRMFRAITEEAVLGTGWMPREMRHTFVSELRVGSALVLPALKTTEQRGLRWASHFRSLPGCCRIARASHIARRHSGAPSDSRSFGR